MGTFNKGILGGFNGTVGTVVGGNWKGIDYMRSRSNKRKTSNSLKQVVQQAKFGLAVNFAQSMKDLLAIGFRDHAVKMTEVNSALAHLLKNAITGTYPNLSITYPQVLVSRGSLSNGINPMAVPGADGIINFSWTDNSGTNKARANDKAILVAYCEVLNQTVYIIGPLRSEARGVLNVPGFAGQLVQTWISFMSENGRDIATSIFTGELTLV